MKWNEMKKDEEKNEEKNEKKEKRKKKKEKRKKKKEKRKKKKEKEKRKKKKRKKKKEKRKRKRKRKMFETEKRQIRWNKPKKQLSLLGEINNEYVQNYSIPTFLKHVGNDVWKGFHIEFTSLGRENNWDYCSESSFLTFPFYFSTE